MTMILALDQGTTSSRAILFNHAGEICGTAQQEFEQIFPKPGWVEHNADEIWSSQLQVARSVLQNAKLSATDIAAIGITNQRETVVLWDRKTGRPVCNAIVWQDRRTAPYCDQLKQDGKSNFIQQKTGLVIDAYFSGTKLKWMLDNIDGLRSRAEKGELAFGTVDSWLIWNLTGHQRHVTDVTNASRTLFLNIATGQWDDELLSLFDIPRAVLPEVLPSSHVYGTASTSLLGGDIPIGGAAGDQQSALFGQNCTEHGMAKNTYGTGCFMLMHVGNKPLTSKCNLLTTVAAGLTDSLEYALEGSVFVAGAAVQWLRDGLGIIKSAAEVESLASTVPDNDGVYLVPAFAGLGAPHWDPYARGTIVGLTRGTTAGHMARATLEGIAFQIADVLDAMKQDSGIAIDQLRVDGGACANNLLMQFQADLLQAPVVRPKIIETTAIGAAYLAGLAVGFWDDVEEIKKVWQTERVFEPQMSATDVMERRARWNDALQRSRGWETAR
jgi:glycerol kinase